MRTRNVRRRDDMTSFFDQEIRKISMEIEKIKDRIRMKEMKQIGLNKIIFEKVKRVSIKRIHRKMEMRQGINDLDRQIFYLNARITNYTRQIQVYIRLKEEEISNEMCYEQVIDLS